MELEKLVAGYLSSAKMMQLATINGGEPWICTVYFVADESRNIYWISKPERRHSKEILQNSKVAVAIPVKFVPGEDVVGLQITGVAQEVSDAAEIQKALRLYADKFSRGEEFYSEFVAGKNPHKLYRVKPTSIVLFDEENFDEPRQELKP